MEKILYEKSEEILNNDITKILKKRYFKTNIKYCPNCGSKLEEKEKELNNCNFCYFKF